MAAHHQDQSSSIPHTSDTAHASQAGLAAWSPPVDRATRDEYRATVSCGGEVPAEFQRTLGRSGMANG